MADCLDRSLAHGWSVAFAVLLFALLLFIGVRPGAAQPAEPLAPLLDGMGVHTRPFATDVPLAQRFADQGLVLTFAFNHAEAVRAFREAQRLDPSCAMCAWGEALARGPHVNAPMNDDDVAPAWAALERARSLASSETPVNRALIDALAVRYTPETVADRAPLDKAYADAMRAVAARFPNDPDVQALFAEALMDTMPWDYWRADGSPKPETEEVIAVLERAIVTSPEHPLALHLWIHTVEKQRPELGIEAAERLGPLVPAAGHLVHMPGHIWIRVGRYHDAVLANQQAVLADDDYLAQCHAQGLYPLGYVPHNHHFLWISAALGGEKATALASAGHMGHHAGMMGEPGMEFLQHFSMSLLYAQALFGEWDAILATPAPPDSLVYPSGVWRFARGLAFARTGRMDAAQLELDALWPLAADTTLGEQFGGLNTLSAILQIAERYLEGELAVARGEHDAAVAALEEAVRLEDALTYDEPPPWALPSRWALGRVLLAADRPAEAETVYRADLAVYPENGRGLFGLQRSLRALGRTAEAAALQPRIDTAWRHADVTLLASHQ
jgi:tetratricopeptide (TPR) repeat protein